MNDAPETIYPHAKGTIERREILEERANRDAFHALLIVSVLFALLLGALLVFAWNTRLAFLPLAPKAAPARTTTVFPARHGLATVDAKNHPAGAALSSSLTPAGRVQAFAPENV